MVNNYPEYAAGISYQKAEENAKHFYNAQVKVDPSDDSMSAVLTKDGEVISELPGEGGGGGEGGESDFTTAEVTFICNDPTLNDSAVDFYGAFYENTELPDASYLETTVPRILFNGSETVIKNILLYKGSAILMLGDFVDEINSTSGNIELTNIAMYKITGNCTIYYTPIGEA